MYVRENTDVQLKALLPPFVFSSEVLRQPLLSFLLDNSVFHL